MLDELPAMMADLAHVEHLEEILRQAFIINVAVSRKRTTNSKRRSGQSVLIGGAVFRDDLRAA